MKHTYDTSGGEWQCDGIQYRFFMGIEEEGDWSFWFDGGFESAEYEMEIIDCKPENVEWVESYD